MPPTIQASIGWYRERWADYARRWTWGERLGALALLATFSATWWCSLRLSLTPLLALWTGWLIVCAAYLHQRKVRFFGPVCFHDLVRTGRQARYMLLRSGYVTVLLVTLSLTYASWFGGGLNGLVAGGQVQGRAMAVFAESFFTSFAWVQFLAAVVFTPICVASGLTEEKERRTLDLLLTTDLEDQEIVLGKLASRLAHLLLVLMAGLPVLALTQFFGGVDPELVLLAFVVTGMTMTSLGALAMLCSVYRANIFEAVLVTYLWLGGFLAVTFVAYGATYVFNFVLGIAMAVVAVPDWLMLPHPNFGNPIITLIDLDQFIRGGMNPYQAMKEALVECAAFQLAFFAWACWRAVQRLRPAHQPVSPLPIWRRTGIEFPPQRRRRKLGNGSPLLWKEMHADAPVGSQRFSALVMYLFLVLGWCLTAFFIASLWANAAFAHSMYDDQGIDWRGMRALSHALTHALGTFLASVMLLAVAFYAAGGISRERERQTLDALLTLPVDRRDILFAKWLGIILAVRPVWWCLGVIWIVGALTGGLHILALPLLLLAWAVHASFLCGLGLWCSLHFRSTLRATVATLGAVFGLLFLCRLAVMNGEMLFFTWLPPDWAMTVTLVFDEGLIPPFALGRLCFNHDDSPRLGAVSAASLRTVGLGLAIYAVAAGALWRANLRRFCAMTQQ